VPCHRTPLSDPLLYAGFAAAPLFWAVLHGWTDPPLQPLRFWSDPLAVAVAVVASPLVEEWLFRGRIQGALLKTPQGSCRVAGLSVANLVTALIFTSLHVAVRGEAWAAAVIVPSLVFGLFRDRYGSIRPSVLLHGFYNAGYLTLFPPL
jgi:membrane protease YdiL (CAAX protease family)